MSEEEKRRAAELCASAIYVPGAESAHFREGSLYCRLKNPSVIGGFYMGNEGLCVGCSPYSTGHSGLDVAFYEEKMVACPKRQVKEVRGKKK